MFRPASRGRPFCSAANHAPKPPSPTSPRMSPTVHDLERLRIRRDDESKAAGADAPGDPGGPGSPFAHGPAERRVEGGRGRTIWLLGGLAVMFAIPFGYLSAHRPP